MQSILIIKENELQNVVGGWGGYKPPKFCFPKPKPCCPTNDDRDYAVVNNGSAVVGGNGVGMNIADNDGQNQVHNIQVGDNTAVIALIGLIFGL